MMENKGDTIRRVKKLLALAEGNPNKNESEKAAYKASRLILLHGIEEDKLRDQLGEDITIIRKEVMNSQRLNPFQSNFWDQVSRIYDCAGLYGVYRNEGQIRYITLKIYGRESNVEFLTLFVPYLLKAIERALTKEKRRLKRNQYNNFRQGAMYAICSRLMEGKKKEYEDQNLPVRQNEGKLAILKEDPQVNIVEKGTIPKIDTALRRGYSKGKDINLHTQIDDRLKKNKIKNQIN